MNRANSLHDINYVEPGGFRVFINVLEFVFKLFPHTGRIKHFVTVSPEIEHATLCFRLFILVIKGIIHKMAGGM